MGSLLHFLDLNQANSSKKLVAHKGKVDGPEAPRNSLEFCAGMAHNYNVIQDIPYSCEVKQYSSKMRYRLNDATIKGLNIDEEMPKRMNNKPNTPSVVARLMGMDALPSQTNSTIRASEHKDERKESIKLSSSDHASSLSSSSIRITKHDMVPPNIKKEHPQEELLQKFKKDFEAWQKSMAWEQSRTLQTNKYLHQAKVNQILVQENLNKEKMAQYWDSRRCTYGKPPETTGVTTQPKNSCGTKNKQSISETRIVILRPNVDEVEGYGSCSPEFSVKEVNMQDFLEEVKERLKSEILGMSTNNTTFGESSGDSKQYARHIAKQIGENVNRNLGTSLIHSASARSHRSEVPCSQLELLETQKSVARSGMLERVKLRTVHDFSKLGKKSDHWKDRKPTIESKDIICENKGAVFDTKPSSPRNLARSFSAPISNGDHMHCKHEASEYSSPESRRKKKDGFNLKGTVSTLRQNLTLKGMFFGRKTEFHSEDESVPNEFCSSKVLATTPSLVSKVGSVEDNSTEVPPSPASLSSSSLDEFCRPGVPSPISPLLVPFIEYHSAAEVFTDSCTIIPVHWEYEEVAIEKSYKNEAVEVEGHAQAYIRNILITAGLYEDQVFDEAFPEHDKSKKLIPKWVFYEVEEAHRLEGKMDEGGYLICDGDTKISRKLLFDLTNEALPRVLKPTRSAFKKRSSCSKNLLDCLWREIQMYMNPQSESSSVDNMVAQHVGADPWCTTVLHEDIYVTAKKLEIVIFEDLVYEFVSKVM